MFFRNVFLSASLAVATACAPIDPFVAPPTTALPVDLPGVEKEAQGLIVDYTNAAKEAVATKQALELPIIASAITAAGLIGFGSHVDGVLVTSIVGGSSGALNSYYEPRTASLKFMDGALAARCVQGLATRARTIYGDNPAKPRYSPAEVTYNYMQVVQLLNGGLDDIRLQVTRQVLGLGKDLSKIIETIKKDVKNQREARERMTGEGLSSADREFIAGIVTEIESCVAKALNS